MSLIKRLVDFYIFSSLHVAFASTSLVLMTLHMFNLPLDYPMISFVFFGTVVGYNFVKYDALTRTSEIQVSSRLKIYAMLSFICFLFAAWSFFLLQFQTQVASSIFLLLTLLYTLPFFPNRRNARNWAGVKIYIVALCWVGVTLILPIINAEIPITTDFFIKCIQRFIFVFVLVLIFEIIDLRTDDPHLKTVPQQIGVQKTKWLGAVLLIIFYLLEFLKTNFNSVQLIINAIIVVMMIGFLAFANASRPKYYSLFWVEMLPIIWLMLLYVSTLFVSR